MQYVNYSSITLKAGGPATGAAKDGQPAAAECGDVESKIATAILKIPECGQCANCTDKNPRRKLCEARLEVRRKLVAAETKIIRQQHHAKNAEKKGSKKRKADSSGQSPPVKKQRMKPGPKPKPKLMKKANGQVKARVTSQGNKRMSIPDELFPEFCRRISAEGTGERMKLINTFAAENPTISVRQVTIRLGEITTRERPECVVPSEKARGRAFVFYLRPRYYKYLPEDERPKGWEKYAAEDEAIFQEEEAKKSSNGGKSDKDFDSTSDVKSDRASDAASSPPDPSDLGDGDETEDEGEQPASKKLKME